MNKRQKQATALRNFQRAWEFLGVKSHRYLIGKDGKPITWEKDPNITPFGGKDPETGWGLLSQ